ncbi:MAG: hypothetical protein HY402_02865 [Elusimicrobia bacterium]|nr:hypothetical protein [Elusimicrobiota bacterium]
MTLILLLLAVSLPTTPRAQAQEPAVFAYQGERHRDPFLSLAQGGTYSPAQTPQQPPNIQRLLLTAILEDSKKTLAVLADPGGFSYVVANGRLLAPDGTQVPEITAVIRKESVLLTTKDGAQEVFLKKNESKERS